MTKLDSIECYFLFFFKLYVTKWQEWYSDVKYLRFPTTWILYERVPGSCVGHMIVWYQGNCWTSPTYCDIMWLLGLCIVLRYIGCSDTLAKRYILYHSFWLHNTLNDTFLLKFRIFWSLKYLNSREICGYIKFFLSKIRQNVSLIHIEYRFMCIVICIVSTGFMCIVICIVSRGVYWGWTFLSRNEEFFTMRYSSIIDQSPPPSLQPKQADAKIWHVCFQTHH